MKYTVEELIHRIGELPPMPEVAQRALELIRNPDYSMKELASVLAMDEAMAQPGALGELRLLRPALSGVYRGTGRELSGPAHAAA
jgi:HD-like signal output (HDOD) protein